MQLNYPKKKNGMYLLKKSDIDPIAEMVLKEYAPDGSVLGMIAFSDTEYNAYGYGPDGVIELEEGNMLIDFSLCGKDCRARRRYTQAHELSHWICHRSYHSPDNRCYEFRKNSFIACRTENIESYRRNDFSQRTDSDWEEWQADSLAAALLMPKVTFIQEVETVF